MSSPLSLLRHWMQAQGIAAFYIPTSDPHNSEYIDRHWQTRAWLTGFTGSAGVAVVTQKRAALWTDSRYFIQASEQLKGSGFTLMRMGETDTPSIDQWLKEEDEALILYATDLTFSEKVPASHFATTPLDPFADIWPSRPALTMRPIEAHPLALAGESVANKLAHLRNDIENTYAPKSTYALVLNDLSQIAWLLNLRGSDIDYNPVFHAYFILLPEGGVLCCDAERLSEAAERQLTDCDIAVAAYDDLDAILETLAGETATWYLPQTMNACVGKILHNLDADTKGFSDTIGLRRSIKNEAEIAGLRRAMEQDGVALVRFRRWLDETIKAGTLNTLTEVDIDERLTAFRAESPRFRSRSFATIAGYGAHGAIVHYEAKPETAARLEPHGLLLLDSGAQYIDGTTDITRTIALGALTEEEQRVYTLVLKGHIGLSRLQFPCDMVGIQLDSVARQPIWEAGYDYGHGTGHGVGAYLCVHEGPQQIRKNRTASATAVPFERGMTITNEPGIYLQDKFGVRIENVLLVEEGAHTAFGHFLRFDTLTLCPIDTAPILVSLLTAEEKNWLNAYHAHVEATLTPLLSEEADRQWLHEACVPIV